MLLSIPTAALASQGNPPRQNGLGLERLGNKIGRLAGSHPQGTPVPPTSATITASNKSLGVIADLRGRSSGRLLFSARAIPKFATAGWRANWKRDLTVCYHFDN